MNYTRIREGSETYGVALTLEEVIADYDQNPGGHNPPVDFRDSGGEESHDGSKEKDRQNNRHERGASGGDGETGVTGVRAVRTHS